MRLLVAEDDKRIAEDIRTVLASAGYAVDLVQNGEEAWFKGDTEDYGLIVLDLGLPGMDGISILKQWRMNGRHMPVLVLTARGSWAERVEGIDAGADDYLPKPFQFEELLARVRALIRRSVGHGAATIEIGRLVVDTRTMRVAVDGMPLSLTPFEFRLVSYLAHHRGRVVPASELQDHVYGDDYSRDANALEAMIARLRKKLGSDMIATRRGFGYLMGEDG
ncbi:response regulator transcription factor [Rhizobium sp. TRM96647]|uniref:response regulator transcription factor n=1 Tax=unclassified Rhizobium TaxID=2613769 RepID=UPI001E416975|nr:MULTISPECIES: response regulator transcription factor [unclassified Rhizobium]MCD2182578.1 response regulator transcription factor [Rhizobium sp. GN54]MCV3734907.1 response regulator transcription factor [Rhizobium sp. TRM96647]MCV3757277.1 response regulator transcription factor [Rhizobium sp. TRM96650]